VGSPACIYCVAHNTQYTFLALMDSTWSERKKAVKETSWRPGHRGSLHRTYPTKDTRGRTTSFFNYNHILSIMPHCLSTVIWIPPIARLRRQPPSRESQTGRYVPFLDQIVSNADPRTTRTDRMACLSRLSGVVASSLNSRGTLVLPLYASTDEVNPAQGQQTTSYIYPHP
jgi:hypothetical protein